MKNTVCFSPTCDLLKQIRRGNRDDSEIFFSFFSVKTYVVTPH